MNDLIAMLIDQAVAAVLSNWQDVLRAINMASSKHHTLVRVCTTDVVK